MQGFLSLTNILKSSSLLSNKIVSFLLLYFFSVDNTKSYATFIDCMILFGMSTITNVMKKSRKKINKYLQFQCHIPEEFNIEKIYT